MSKLQNYDGNIELISGITQKNDNDFALIEAHAVLVDEEGKRLDERLVELEDVAGADQIIQQVFENPKFTTLEGTVNDHRTQLDQVNNTINDLEDKINKIDIDDINNKLEEAGNDHRLMYDENTSTLYLVKGDFESIDEALEAGKILSSVQVSGGGAANQIPVPVLTPITPQTLTVLYGDPVELKFNFISKYPNDDTPNLVGGTARIFIDGNLRETRRVTAGDQSFDLTRYIGAGTNSVRIAITNDEGGTRSISWVVNAVDFRLTDCDLNEDRIYPANVSTPFYVTPVGAIEKTLYMQIDDQNPTAMQIGTTTRPRLVTIPAMLHGSHSIKLYMKTTIDNKEITSNVLFYNLFFVDPDSDEVIIRCNYDGTPLHQYTPHTFKYAVYDPKKIENVEIKIEVDGEILLSGAVDRKEQSWTYRPEEAKTITLAFISGTTRKEYTIVVEPFPFDISPAPNTEFVFDPIGRSNMSEDRDQYENNGYKMTVSDGFDWYNGGWRTDSNGVSYFLIKAGDQISFNCKPFAKDITTTGLNIKTIFKAAQCKKPDAKVGSCVAFNAQGQGVGLDIEAQDGYLYYGSHAGLHVQYVEEEIIDFEINVQSRSQYREIIGYVEADPSRGVYYPENTSIQQSNMGKDPVGVTFGSPDCDVWLYKFRVYDRSLSEDDILTNYFADAPDSTEMSARYLRNDFMNENGLEINYQKLSTLYPDLRILLIKCPRFTTSKKDTVDGCTVQQIMGNGEPAHNWIATKVKLKGQGTSSDAYGDAGRNLDLNFKGGFTSTIDEKLTFKKYAMTDNSVPINYVNIKVNIASSENANNSRLADDFNTYQPFLREARKKDPRVRDTMEFHPCVIFVEETGEDASGKFVQTVEFEPDKKYHFYACGDFGNSKKNSEAMGMTSDPYECIIEFSNNVTPQCLYLRDAAFGTNQIPDIEFDANGDPTGFWDGKAFEFRYPDVGKLTNNTIGGDLYEEQQEKVIDEIFDQLGGNSEDKTEEEKETLRQQAEEQARSAENLAKIKQMTDEESVKNKAIVQEMVRRFRVMWEWVDSTNPLNATNNALSAPYTYNNQTYTNDTSEYRLAKFAKEHSSHFASESLLYHYLFTERHTMIDNRAKNTFIHYNVDGPQQGHWDYVFNYDDDTAEGCDNRGDLSFRYGYEDTDRVDGSQEFVFNAYNSVLWCNVRDALKDPLQTFATTQNDMMNGSRVLKKFNDYQDMKPERLEMIDMRRKYIRPYEGYTRPNGVSVKDDQFFTDMMFGKKKWQRQKYEIYQNIYAGSKYTTSAVDSERIEWRADRESFDKDNPKVPYNITPYSYQYVTMVFDTSQIIKHRAKPGEIVTITPTRNFKDLNTYVYAPRYISNLGDLSQVYMTSAAFSPGPKLTELIVGSPDPNYNSPVFPGLGDLSLNVLLEKIDLRGCTNMSRPDIDVSSCVNLKELYATRTNASNVILANGGHLRKLELESPTSLSLRNLFYLEAANFKLTSYKNLARLIFENCPGLNVIDILNKTDENTLRNIRLLDIDWNLINSDLPNRLAKLQGIDANGADTEHSVLTGKLHLQSIRKTELELYRQIWPQLTVTFDGEIPQHTITYKNGDKVVAVIPWDVGSYIPDPTVPGEGYDMIPIPTKEPTAQYTFIFDGWEPNLVGTPLGDADVTLNAKYREEIRTYTVTWYDDIKSTQTVAIESQQIQYGKPAVFTGQFPTKRSTTQLAFVFEDWDRSTAFIEGDTDVYPKWMEGAAPTNPTAVATANPASIKKMLENITQSASGNTTINTYFPQDAGGFIQVQTGYMPTFSNVTSHVLVDSKNPFVMDSKSYKKFDNIKPFAKDQGFVIALDYSQRFNGNLLTQTILSCRDATKLPATGFDLTADILDPSAALKDRRYTNPKFRYGASATSIPYQESIPFILGSQNTNTSSTTWKGEYVSRNIVVIRRIKGDTNLYFYTNNRYSLDNIARSTTMATIDAGEYLMNNMPLIIGASPTNSNATTFNNYGYGQINYLKVWEDDLGDDVCRKICSWIYDTKQFDYCGTQLYYSYVEGSTSSGPITTASFVSHDSWDTDYIYSDVSAIGGWKYSKARTYYNEKIFKGLSPVWQKMIKEVIVKNMKGGGNDGDQIPGGTAQDSNKSQTDSLTSNNKLYAPSAYEVDKQISLSGGNQQVINSSALALGECNGLQSYYLNFTDNAGSRMKHREGYYKQYPTEKVYFPWLLRTPNFTTNSDDLTYVDFSGVIKNGYINVVAGSSIKGPNNETIYILPNGGTVGDYYPGLNLYRPIASKMALMVGFSLYEGGSTNEG